MRLSLFGSNAKVLLVGEGNFSFAATLVKHNLNIALVATCYDNNIKETAKQNVEILKNHGAQVILGVDATQLENHDTLKSEHFDTVVFNFPHVGGKMRIEKNRELIKRFFISVRKVIQRNGQVLMSLCNGQGGTLADECQRTWNDSWQITEMAAHGDFIVSAVEPFDSTLFDTYTVTGYRSLEKKFNTQGSLVHILKLADEPNLENIRPVIPIDLSKSHHKIVNWNDLILELDNLGGLDKNVEKNQGFTKSYHFDITVLINDEFTCSKFYEVLFNHAGLLIDNVEFISSYVFPNQKESKTFRITYKSNNFPLHRKRVIYLHENTITNIVERELGIMVPR